MWQVNQKNQKDTINDNSEIYKNEKSISEEGIDSDILDIFMDDSYSSEGVLKANDEGKHPMNAYSLDRQVNQMIEKSDGMWKCKMCGKTAIRVSHIKEHAESHVEGMSPVCHFCNKSFSHRSSLRKHINDIHSELISCDLCGKTGMNKKSYFRHKQRHN